MLLITQLTMATWFAVQNIYGSPQISRKQPQQPMRRMTLFDLRYREACCYFESVSGRCLNTFAPVDVMIAGR